MEMNKFVDLFAEQFDNTPRDSFAPQTKFKELDEWDSLTTLSVIAMVDEEFGIKITGADIRAAETIEDLYNRVTTK